MEANVPNKVKICVWRATSNILATHSNLVRRGVQIDQSCFLCNNPAETTLHTLRDYPFSKAVWFAYRLGLRVSQQEFTMKDWLCSVLDEVSLSDFNLVLMLIWAIWKECNSHLWDGTRAVLAFVALQATSWLQEFHRVLSKPHTRRPLPPCEMVGALGRLIQN